MICLINGHFRILDWRYRPYIRPIFQALISGNTPTKYGQTYGTNVPPSVGSWNSHWYNWLCWKHQGFLDDPSIQSGFDCGSEAEDFEGFGAYVETNQTWDDFWGYF